MTAAALNTVTASPPRRSTRRATTSRTLVGSPISAIDCCSSKRPAALWAIAPDRARWRNISPVKNGLPFVSRRNAWANATPGSVSS
ncbi:MAG: hypothetical protein IPQ14_02760 [Candidatus Microthrix sp.]|uniref:hypothetical protein n=1 Tax=Candidatus Neomicrothrix sp. TaxID=2719034 RepID=UPI0025C57F5B|nr:hypothetical protein [Candidatus Microthrix sp.]MBL0203262.1 hypothetical protein [Candidatus Microthrix sp.]